MKKHVLILILYIPVFCCSQTEDRKIAADSLTWTDFSCEKGIKEAEADFEKGIYNSYSYGLTLEMTAKNGKGFQEFYKAYIRKKYLINIEKKGCVVSDYSKCYSETMEKFISKKFGSDIYSKARKEALKLFAKNN